MFEYTPLVEYSLVHWDIKANNRCHHLYIGAGLSLFYFNPQAKVNGEYYYLRPLCTEGQGLTGRALPCSQVSVALPFVTGYRYRISKQCVMCNRSRTVS